MVYIQSTGTFLPGEPVDNATMEARLGTIGGKASRLKERILKQNGIRTRHYAIAGDNQTSQYRNSEMAAHAIRNALSQSTVGLEDIQYLSVATSQGDLPLPGFASMVHGELGNPSCEISTSHGICASGMAALKNAFVQIKAGEKSNAVVCASEFASRLLKGSRYEHQAAYRQSGKIPFDTEFLRWMLSDGAGAFVLTDRPAERGLSIKIDWLELKSYADRHEVCMFIGGNKNGTGRVEKSWLDYASYQESVDDGSMNLKQDVRILDNVVRVGVDFFFELIEAGRMQPSELDWIACHYSSHVFRGKIFELLAKGGVHIPEERWFSNLYTKGNTGSASIFIMLDELFRSGRLRPGQKILAMVPESGRFIASYMLLTVVDGNQAARATTSGVTIPEPAAPRLNVKNGDAIVESLVRRLTRVWIDFESRLNQTPIVAKLNTGNFTLEDYRRLLFNMRQQVMEGARWIARAASGITIEAFPLRSLFIAHAGDEHRDYQMLERNYVAAGGRREDIVAGEKNIGSEALSAWMFHRASRENPFDLLGAMFIIEGLGTRMAHRWGTMIRDQLGLDDEAVSFLLYHGANDENHFERLEEALDSGLLSEALADQIVKTAKVTARLYLLQLEELDNV